MLPSMEENLDPSSMEGEAPPYFRCPISMEVMKDPVTISTGVTYERSSIEKWFFTYNKKFCPATMQIIDDFVITPNSTLKRLILSWKNEKSAAAPVVKCDELVVLLQNIESWPFKVSSLKKLRLIMAVGDAGVRSDFVRANGIEVILQIAVQVVSENGDFANFDACEEALGVLSEFPLWRSEKLFELLSEPESMKTVAVVLQRGTADGRFSAITILQNMAENGFDWRFFIKDQGTDFFKSLLDLVSDDQISAKSSSSALKVLIQITESSKKSRLKSIDAGAVRVLIELLPDANRSKCEKILHALKLLSECAEGRLALVEHALGLAVVTKKMMNVSNLATKTAIKILWLICKYYPNQRVLEEMVACGSVKKLSALLHLHGGSKVVKILKLHGNFWRRFPCFP